MVLIKERRMEARKVWFKGTIVPVEEARVSVLSPTAQYGLNVFEGIRCYKGKDDQMFAFRLKDHFRRLSDSCKLIGICLRYQPPELQELLTQTIRANDYHEDVAVRMTFFVDTEGSWTAEGPVEMFIAPVRKARTDIASPRCVSACISTWERINDNCFPPRIKAGANYINARYGHLEARRHGYDLPIFLGRNGKISEGGGACLFMYRNGVLCTPTLTSSVLESITRSTVLQLAVDLGIKTTEREIDRTELYLADELFLCGSASELTPVTTLDSLRIGCGVAGPVTLSLLRQYLAVVSHEVPGYDEWVTPMYS